LLPAREAGQNPDPSIPVHLPRDATRMLDSGVIAVRDERS